MRKKVAGGTFSPVVKKNRINTGGQPQPVYDPDMWRSVGRSFTISSGGEDDIDEEAPEAVSVGTDPAIDTREEYSVEHIYALLGGSLRPDRPLRHQISRERFMLVSSITNSFNNYINDMPNETWGDWFNRPAYTSSVARSLHQTLLTEHQSGVDRAIDANVAIQETPSPASPWFDASTSLGARTLSTGGNPFDEWAVGRTTGTITGEDEPE